MKLVDLFSGKWRQREREKGVTLIEVLIAVGLFSVALTIASMILIPILAGTQQEGMVPHMARIQTELFARQLERDSIAYSRMYAYPGEVRKSDGLSRISATAITLSGGSGGLLYKINDERDFLIQVTELSDALYYATSQNPADTSDPDKWVYTLLCIGKTGGIEVVYYMSVQNIVGGGLSYEVERIDGEGISHRVSFKTPSKDSSGVLYSLSNPDQDLPYFRRNLQPQIEEVSGMTPEEKAYRERLASPQIEVLLPNPFSRSVFNPISKTVSYTYSNPMALRYYLKQSSN